MLVAKVHNPLISYNYFKFEVCSQTLADAERIIARVLACHFQVRRIILVYKYDLLYDITDGVNVLGTLEVGFDDTE